MKKFAWTMAELIVALIIIILISGVFISVFKPGSQKSKLFVYATMKNITKGNSGILEKHNDLEGTATDATKDWYCLQLADLFSLKEPANCNIPGKNGATTTTVNMKFANDVTIQGISNPWRTPTGCDYKVKNIIIDIDGEKGLNRLWVDRFPMRIYNGDAYSGMITVVNCQDDSIYNEAGTKVTLTDATGKSPYCKQGFTAGGAAVSKNFYLDNDVVTYDIYRAVSDEEETRAVIIASALPPADADCGAYAGNGFFHKKQCALYSKKLLAKCAQKDTTCDGCGSVSPSICPLNSTGNAQVSEDTCKNTTAPTENPNDVNCFTVLHKPSAGISMILSTVIGEIDM